jgi:ubiquitin-protein ligase
MLTPVFHPNIDPQKICIGDHWSAGESLPQLIVRIGEMLCYQSYNVKSPLNAEAAAWAELNAETLPLQRVDLTAGL